MYLKNLLEKRNIKLISVQDFDEFSKLSLFKKMNLDEKKLSKLNKYFVFKNKVIIFQMMKVIN